MPKSWFITGTSSGFGRTLTETLLARGDRLGVGGADIVAAVLGDPGRDQHHSWNAAADHRPQHGSLAGRGRQPATSPSLAPS